MDLALYEEKDGFRTNWRLRRTEIRTRLTAEGVIRPKWKHELTLFQAMRERYPDTLYQYRPEWLGRQSLDLYIPSIRTAIEYQGIQHYLPVAFFGGEEALEQRRELDLQKKELCEQNDVRLIEWAYDVEPTVRNIKRMLAMDKMSKLAVFFPGIGYTTDRPLLHFSRRIAAAHGYEIRIMDYKGFPSKVKGDRKRMEESFDIALGQAREMLSGVDLAEYEDILFIGKSIGTIVAAKIASESPEKDRIRMILYTPLDDTFTFLDMPSDGSAAFHDTSSDGGSALPDTPSDGTAGSYSGKAIAFTGDDDPWVGREKSRISALCRERGIPCSVIPQTNHSLESGDVFSDLKELYRIMEETERFIVGPGEE